jgi:hypothetical protein
MEGKILILEDLSHKLRGNGIKENGSTDPDF